MTAPTLPEAVERALLNEFWLGFNSGLDSVSACEGYREDVMTPEEIRAAIATVLVAAKSEGVAEFVSWALRHTPPPISNIFCEDRKGELHD